MTVADELKQLLSKRLTKCAEWDRDGEWREHAAYRILNADIDDTHSFNASRDTERLRDLQRCLAKADNLIAGLEHTSIRHLNAELSQFEVNDDELGAVVDLRTRLRVAQKAVSSLKNRAAYKRTANRKVNWRAASIARTCRFVWAENEWYSNPEKYGKPPLNWLLALQLPQAKRDEWRELEDKFQAHIRDFAPKTQNHYRPAAFGIFLESVFETLGVEGRNGDLVSASTALDALRNLQRQEQC